MRSTLRSVTLGGALAAAVASCALSGVLSDALSAQQTREAAQGKMASGSSSSAFPSTASAIERGATSRVDSQPAKAKVVMPRALEQLAAQHILVLPVQTAIFADSLGWGGQISSVRSYLQTVDDEITYALKERGLEGKWVLPDAVVRSAKRNSDFAADPRALDTRQLRPGVKTDDFLLHEPLASQLRSLIALNDARYVLVPVEVRIVNTPTAVSNGVVKTGAKNVQQLGSAGPTTVAPPRAHAVLRIAVIDARRSQLQWAGDVTGAPLASFSPAIAADLASRLADLIAPSN